MRTEADTARAICWYQAEAPEQVDPFRAVLDERLAGLEENPHLVQAVYRTVRRLLLRPFPYILYYEVREETVLVIAIVHARRDPSVWKSRVR